MDNDTQKLATDLLIWMLNQLEKEGNTLQNSYFDFGQNGKDRTKFNEYYSWYSEKMEKTLNYCYTHQYIKPACLGSKLDPLQLTSKGFALAQSTKRIKPIKIEPQTIFNFNAPITGGNVQVGNQNTQNIKMIIEDFKERIDKTEVSIEEKNKAKEILYSFFSNPIIAPIYSELCKVSIANLTGVLS